VLHEDEETTLPSRGLGGTGRPAPFEVEQPNPIHAEVIHARPQPKQQRRYTLDAFIGEDKV